MMSVLLACSLLALQGLVYPHALEHVSHHAHHGADAHSTVLCSWMCAAGQDLDTVTGLFHANVPLRGLVDHEVSDSLQIESRASRTSRGPPVHSLS
ncbi:MAG TPA: hypothetical protein PLT27_09405 [Nitrospira sp.]|nr:hypothetical protein [Nitrospira sp.]